MSPPSHCQRNARGPLGMALRSFDGRKPRGAGGRARSAVPSATALIAARVVVMFPAVLLEASGHDRVFAVGVLIDVSGQSRRPRGPKRSYDDCGLALPEST
jgi:hypothetical protein